MDFESLKQSQSSFDKITKALEQSSEKPEISGNSKNKYQDDRIWKPELDKTGNGYAVIRFLPATTGEEMPWQRVWSHAFQDKGGWYIENSLTTLNQKDPVSEENTRLWNTGVDSDKEIARKRKRKLSYYSNIYVVSDPKHPDNEGKVFLFKFGKKIFDKITEAMQPAFDDETPINPFDFWKGANFKLKAKNVAGYRNYDSSEFSATSALLDDDDALEAIWKKQYSLEEFTAADQFKSYGDLEKRLNAVLNTSRPPVAAEVATEEEEIVTAPPEPVTANATTDDDALSYFQRLAEE